MTAPPPPRLADADASPPAANDLPCNPWEAVFERAHQAQRLAQQRLAKRRRASRRTGSLPDRDGTRHAPVAADTNLPPGIGTSPTQRQGTRFEDMAVAHLRRAGLPCLARNLRCRAGEIDIVAMDGPVIVFIEVRARRRAGYGGAAASVTHAKQARLRRAAAFFLPRLLRLPAAAAALPPGGLPLCRFDVMAFEAERLLWLRHAFSQ